jgi:lysophospholipase L1-like esterase
MGGFSFEEEVVEAIKTDPECPGRWKQPSLEWSISKKDPHPNAKGHQKIAEFIYDRLG